MNIYNLINELKSLVSDSEQNKRDADFYQRIICQLILTHGVNGKLSCDPNLYEQSKEAMKFQIIFGYGQIEIIEK